MKKISVNSSIVVILLISILFITVIPRVSKDYNMMIVNLSLIYTIATFGISVLLGMGGQLSFGAVTFMGVGAYITANISSGRWGLHINTSLALIIVIIASMLLSFLIALVLFRLKNTYFTFATIGLVQVAWCFYMNYKPLFGGPDGISGISTLNIFGFKPSNYVQWFYILVIFVFLVAMLIERIRRTKLGRSLASIRDNEIAAYTLGVNVYMTKVIAFTIAGGLAALAGSLYAMHGQFVCGDMFTFERATSYIIMAMLGGVNSTAGIIVGSVLITMLPEWLRAVKEYLQLFYGIGIILLMVFMPMGLAGLYEILAKKIKQQYIKLTKQTVVEEKGENR